MCHYPSIRVGHARSLLRFVRDDDRRDTGKRERGLSWGLKIDPVAVISSGKGRKGRRPRRDLDLKPVTMSLSSPFTVWDRPGIPSPHGRENDPSVVNRLTG